MAQSGGWPSQGWNTLVVIWVLPIMESEVRRGGGRGAMLTVITIVVPKVLRRLLDMKTICIIYDSLSRSD